MALQRRKRRSRARDYLLSRTSHVWQTLRSTILRCSFIISASALINLGRTLRIC
jgi:hypothetical protein